MQAIYLDCVDSTNEEAKRLLGGGEIRSVAYVLAREQTAGKGSRGRSWVSPRDAGLYLSVLQRFEAGLEAGGVSLPLLTLAAGVACAEVLRDALSVEIRLKPINDLYLGDGKVGGILVESVLQGNRIRALVTGVGINIREVPRELPAGAARATSLQACASPHALAGLDPGALPAELAGAITGWHARAIAGCGASVRDAWRRLSIPGARFPIDV